MSHGAESDPSTRQGCGRDSSCFTCDILMLKTTIIISRRAFARLVLRLKKNMRLRISLPANIRNLRLELSRLQASSKDWKNFNAECWRSLAAAAKSPAPTEPANSTSSRQAPRALIGRQRTRNCCALSFSYLQFKVVEALQPHPAYESDDGFQPLGVILSMSFGEERKATKALAELHGAGLSLADIVDDLVARDMVVKTGYEACNGDAMIGLAANLPKREAAHLERRKLIGTFAAKYSLLLQWNEDGTGSLLTSAGRRVQPSGSVWTLLSCLYTIENSVAKRPKLLH